MKSKYAVILTSLTLVIMLVSTTSLASAQVAVPDGHATVFIPSNGIIPPTGTITAVTGVATAQNEAITAPVVFHIQDNFPINVQVSQVQADCATEALTVPPTMTNWGAEDIMTILVDQNLAPIGVYFPGLTGNTQSATVLLGPIGNANPVINTNGAPQTYLVNLATQPIAGAPQWLQTSGPNIGSFGIPNAADANVLGTNTGNRLVVCGCTDQFPLSGGLGNGDGICLGENDGVVAESYQLAEIVGGMLMEISSVSLLVSGAQTNALWLLPILGLAGTIIAIRKLEA